MSRKYSEDRNRERIVDKQWNQIFSDYSVLDYVDRYGFFKITSTEINRYKEARLMTKFDYATNLPDIFYDNDLAILPTKRGEYIIGRFNAYQKLVTTDKTLLKQRREIQFPSWIETISPHSVTSESTMLNAVSVSGMLKDLFNEEKIVQTVSGRMSSKSFSFNIDQNGYDAPFSIDVTNSQVEIDGGFETPDKLILFEAKNATTNSFLIRQLYYPYQLWARQVNKEIVPVFLQYANDTYNFSIFKFNQLDHYNSLELVDRRNYVFVDEHTTIEDVVRIQKSVHLIEGDDKIPFPQANSLSKVLGIIESINSSKNKSLTAEDLTLVNDFVMRQAHYYSRAAMFLGFINVQPDFSFVLTRFGEDYIRANRKARNLRIAKQMLQHKVFHHVFLRGLERGKPLNANETYAFLESEDFYEAHLSPSTRKRRASTISSWVRYLFDMVDR